MEVLGLLLSLAGFGVDANPQAPSADEVLATAPPRADYVAHADLVTFVPNNVKVLLDLPKHPALADNKELRTQLETMLAQAQGARAMASGMLGMDPIDDLTSVTMWLSVPDTGDPLVLVVARGVFPADIITRIGNPMGAPVVKVSGVDAISSPDGDAMIALSPRGELLLGTPAWVKPRLAKSYKRRKTSALIKGAGPMLDRKPAMLFASAPSKRAVRAIERELPGEDEQIAVDLATGHAFLGVGVHHDGVAWTAVARTKSGYSRALRSSEGALDLMRAFHHGTRGVTRVVLAALPSFAGSNEVVDAILAHADDIEALVMGATGDGSFEVEWVKNPKTRTVGVVATGKDLSDVFPAAALLPVLGGAGAWLALSARADASEPEPLEDLSKKSKRPKATRKK